MKKIKLLVLLFVLIPVLSLYAQEEQSEEDAFFAEDINSTEETLQAKYTSSQKIAQAEKKEDGVETKTSLEFQVSTRPEAKLILHQTFKVPVFQGKNSLVNGNNLTFGFHPEVTPISAGILGNIVLTPIAFIELEAGGQIGSGWNINLFGGEVRGSGVNIGKPAFNDKNNTIEVIGKDGKQVNRTTVDINTENGIFFGSHFGGAFQFDLAAVVPGDWHHVLLRTYHEAKYMTYSAAGKYDPWFFESDYGENQNGWRYYGSYVLAYQMPIILNTVAFLAEMNKFLYDYDPLNPNTWGGNMARWDFSLVLNFKFTEKFSTALVGQLRLHRNYSNFTYENKDDKDPDYNRYFQDRELIEGRTLKFYRVAALLNYKLR